MVDPVIPNGPDHVSELDIAPDFLPGRMVVGYDDPTDNPEEVSEGARLVAVIAAMLDAARDRLEQSTRARFPRLAAIDYRESAMGYLATNRGIVRGRTESAAAFADRLAAWRYPRGHRVRGVAVALAEQVRFYFGAGTSVEVVDVRGLALGVDANGAYTKRLTDWDDWDITWDGATYTSNPATNWARFWVAVYTPAITEPPDWGDSGLWATAGGVLGMVGISVSDVALLRRELLYGRTAWRPGGTQPQWLIFALDGAPVEATGSALGEWTNWSITDPGDLTRKPTRNQAWRYVPAKDQYSDYVPSPTWSDASEMPGGATYTAVPTWHDGPIVLHDGEEYTPSPTWHASARLVHDGTPTEP